MYKSSWHTICLPALRPKASDERGGQFSAKAATDESWDTYWATNDGVTAADYRVRLSENREGQPYDDPGIYPVWDNVSNHSL